MRGIGDRLERSTRIKILQNRAHAYNEDFDKEEEKGLNPDEIRKNLLRREYEKRHAEDDKQTLPFEENRHVIKVSGGTDFGFDETHKTLSETKTMYQEAQKIMVKKKDLKQRGEKDPDADLQKRYKDQEEAMKKKIYKDHVNDMFKADGIKKDADKTNYQQNYEFNDDFQKECDAVDFSYHQKKNDLKWYSEAYVKYKSTLRK